MALFSRTKKVAPEAAPVASPSKVTTQVDHSHILVQPRITEKATLLSGMSVYVFDVASVATKRSVMQAVESYYKVRPRKVRIVTVPVKRVRNMKTGQTGERKGGKKAYVYLKKGETITIA